MYIPISTQTSCALAWLEAVKAVDHQYDHEAHNVIVDVADPIRMTPLDKQITEAVNTALRAAGKWPVSTVANTIFPASTYAVHGAPAFYDVYLSKVYPKIKKHQGEWGRYFERMISFRRPDGAVINPLRDVVEKMKQQVASERCFRNVYELNIYDPVRDAGPVMNRQCLSFLSFKLLDTTPRTLLLTAVYRNHYYIQRLLGNLIGLGNLMKFVAAETNTRVGSLTVVSTHAQVDSAGSRSNVQALLAKCDQLVTAAQP